MELQHQSLLDCTHIVAQPPITLPKLPKPTTQESRNFHATDSLGSYCPFQNGPMAPARKSAFCGNSKGSCLASPDLPKCGSLRSRVACSSGGAWGAAGMCLEQLVQLGVRHQRVHGLFQALAADVGKVLLHQIRNPWPGSATSV